MGGQGSGRGGGPKLSYPRATARARIVDHLVLDTGKTRREISKLANVSPGRGSDALAARISVKLELAEAFAKVFTELLGRPTPVQALFAIANTEADAATMAPARPIRARSKKPAEAGAKRAPATPALTLEAKGSSMTDPAQTSLPLPTGDAPTSATGS